MICESEILVGFSSKLEIGVGRKFAQIKYTPMIRESKKNWSDYGIILSKS